VLLGNNLNDFVQNIYTVRGGLMDAIENILTHSELYLRIAQINKNEIDTEEAVRKERETAERFLSASRTWNDMLRCASLFPEQPNLDAVSEIKGLTGNRLVDLALAKSAMIFSVQHDIDPLKARKIIASRLVGTHGDATTDKIIKALREIDDAWFTECAECGGENKAGWVQCIHCEHEQ
jgi:hypothetical protein